MDKIKKNILILVLMNSIIFLVSLAYLIYFNLTDGTELFPACRFKENLFIYCPGCGGSRSLAALFSFDIIESFILYPPIIISSLVILYYDIRLILSIIKKDATYTDNTRYYAILIIPISIILTFVIRNILLIKFGYDPIGDIIS